MQVTRCGDTEFRWGERTYIMGIVNLSPDSFSGDGLAGVDAAVAQARRFVQDGADILDIGGESTRPGAATISEEEEIKRVVPVIERLAAELKVPVSIDTYKYEVARRAIEAGAKILNDQWGLHWDARLASLAAERGILLVLMSNQRDMKEPGVELPPGTPRYPDIMTEVLRFLRQGIAVAEERGVPAENIVVDPGIGFGKSLRQNLELIRRLGELKELGKPVLIGPSRKSFIGRVLDLPPEERIEGTAAAVAISIANGADIVRVHDVRQMVRVARMSDAITRQSR